MKYFRGIDNYLLTESGKMYREDMPFKPHSAFLLMTIFMVQSTVVVFTEFDKGFLVRFRIPLLVVVACCSLYIAVINIYLWRTFLRLRRDGVNKDRNLFLTESAGILRRRFFYISLCFYPAALLYSSISGQDPQHVLRFEFFMSVILRLAKSLAFTVIVFECVRIFSREIESWSNLKHALVVLAIAIGMTILGTYTFIQYHGISLIW